MVITGSVILVQPGAHEVVEEALKDFPFVTYHAKSEEGTDLVVNFEAESTADLERLVNEVKAAIPEIVEINHIYVNFEDEIEDMVSRERDQD
jgi:nitrate reductase NapAB chaperone NapD